MRWLPMLLLLYPACFSIDDLPDGGVDQMPISDLPPCAAGQVCAQPITASPLHGIWAASASESWAVGEAGTILHYVAGAWASVQSPATETLYAVWGSGASDVWTVGSQGRILHWDGMAWSNLPSPSSSDLRSIYGASKTDVWAVGDAPLLGASGTLLHFTGAGWQQITSGLPQGSLSAVYAGAGQVFLAGDSGLLLHQQGTSWISVNTPTSADFKSVWAVNASGALASGTHGALVYFDGTTAHDLSIGTNSLLGLTANPAQQGGLLVVGGSDVLRIAPPWSSTSQLTSASGATLAAATTAGQNVWLAGSRGGAGYLGYVTP